MSGYCETHGKRRYPSKKQAKRELRWINNRRPARFYKCDLGGWHVTTDNAELAAMYRTLKDRQARGEASDATLKRYRQRLRAAKRAATEGWPT